MSSKGQMKNSLLQELEQLRDQVAKLRRSRASLKRKHKSLIQEIKNRAKRRVDELQKQCERLKEQDATKDAFLSTVAHEIRTPLTSILSFAEILIHYPEENPKTRLEFYSIIMQESKRLTRLVNNVLDLSKIKAGKMQWNFRKINIRKAIQRSIRTMSALLEERQIQLTCEIEDDLPALRADEDRLLQVLENLLSNAIKFTPNGGSIHFRANRMKAKRAGDPKSLIHISLTDSGVGIKRDELTDIFQHFKQCKDTIQEVKGTGLGLSICKEIVFCHRGNIWAESTYGRGTTLHITFPVWNSETAVLKSKITSKYDPSRSTSSP